MDKCIRIKRNIRIFEEQDELHFIKSYGKAVSVQKNRIVLRMIENLLNCGERRIIISELAKEFQLEEHRVGQLVESLIKAGVLEIYTNEVIRSNDYIRYETQLSFFDLLQPTASVREKMNWQLKINHLHIVIVGIGGIGNYVLLSLAAMGIGKLTIIDGDIIEESNLNRQIIFGEDDLGKKKARIAIQKIGELNKSCQVKFVDAIITTKEEALLHLLNQGVPDFVFICADKPALLPVWINEISKENSFPFLNVPSNNSLTIRHLDLN